VFRSIGQSTNFNRGFLAPLYLLVLFGEFVDPVLDFGREPATATTDFDGRREFFIGNESVQGTFAKTCAMLYITEGQ